MTSVPRPARLATRAAAFSYGHGRQRLLVDGWDAEFHGGSVTAVTGPSGCGKSTRLYLLGLMLRLGDGAVEIDGDRVDHLPDRDRAHLRAGRYGFVFQDSALDPTRSVLDNVLETTLYRGAPRRASEPRARALMEQFGITVPPHRKPGQISGGQAQRIALCRALLGSPDILLADEPTGNLDPASAQTVLDAFRAHADGGGCVIVVTHDPVVAAHADHRLDLAAGAA